MLVSACSDRNVARFGVIVRWLLGACPRLLTPSIVDWCQVGSNGRDHRRARTELARRDPFATATVPSAGIAAGWRLDDRHWLVSRNLGRLLEVFLSPGLDLLVLLELLERDGETPVDVGRLAALARHPAEPGGGDPEPHEHVGDSRSTTARRARSARPSPRSSTRRLVACVMIVNPSAGRRSASTGTVPTGICPAAASPTIGSTRTTRPRPPGRGWPTAGPATCSTSCARSLANTESTRKSATTSVTAWSATFAPGSPTSRWWRRWRGS